jgi:23S rRNA pseudouridine2605 synthase
MAEVRLQKFLADAGIASRRASEKLILEGEVTVNGRVVRELGTKIDPLHDHVQVDGRPVKARRKLYIAINKPPGYICSKADPEKRKTVGSLLPREWNNLQSVGRLDYNSEGLIFFTNDGEFALRLTHPRYGVRKKYMVTVRGEVTPEHVRQMQKGIFSDGEMLRAAQGRILKSNNSHSLVELILAEGKNREVRRMFETLGFEVERLQRVQVGAVKLGQLPKGKWRALTPSEIRGLMGDSKPAAKASGPSSGRDAGLAEEE